AEVGAGRGRVPEDGEAVLRREQGATPMRCDPGHFSLSMSPCTNQRCMRTITDTGGSSTIIAAAIAMFHSGSCEVRGTRNSMPMTAVRISGVLVIISGQR